MAKDFAEAFINQHMAMQERTAAWIRSLKKDSAQPDNPTSPIIGNDSYIHGINIIADPSVEPGMVEVRDQLNRVVGIITGMDDMPQFGSASSTELQVGNDIDMAERNTTCAPAIEAPCDTDKAEWIGVDIEDDAEELNLLIADTVMAARRLQIGDIDMEGFISFLKFHFPGDWGFAVDEFPDPASQAESKALGRAMEIAKR